jgi:predicted nucleotidyltransferase
MSENNLSKFEKVLKKFVAKQIKNQHVVGILVTGSYVHSTPDKNSDLDIHVVLDESKFRERGNTWIDGIEIEYFINPICQIKAYYKEEVGEKPPHTAHMFANSLILFQKGGALDELVKEAKTILKRPIKTMNKNGMELAKYFLDDMAKDLEDVLIKRDFFALNFIAQEIFQKCLQIFLKQKGVEREKTKRLSNQLRAVDKNFNKLFSSAVLEREPKKKYTATIKLINYVENLVGGKRPKEWKIRGKLTT